MHKKKRERFLMRSAESLQLLKEEHHLCNYLSSLILDFILEFGRQSSYSLHILYDKIPRGKYFDHLDTRVTKNCTEDMTSMRLFESPAKIGGCENTAECVLSVPELLVNRHQ